MRLMLVRFLISLCFIYCMLAVMLKFLLPYWLTIIQDLEGDTPEKVNTAINLSEALEGMGLLHIPVIAGIGIGAVVALLVIKIIPKRRS
jgi:hypothetical protein